MKKQLYPMPLEVSHEISKALVYAARERFMAPVESTTEAAATMQAAGLFAVAASIDGLTQVFRSMLSLIQEEFENDRREAEKHRAEMEAGR